MKKEQHFSNNLQLRTIMTWQTAATCERKLSAIFSIAIVFSSPCTMQKLNANNTFFKTKNLQEKFNRNYCHQIAVMCCITLHTNFSVFMFKNNLYNRQIALCFSGDIRRCLVDKDETFYFFF